jgi:hypothetical protein
MRFVLFPVRARFRQRGFGAAAAVTIWVLVGGVFAQPRPDVALHRLADSVATHERFTLTISASVPAHRAVQFPAADAGSSVFGNLKVLERHPVRKQRVGAGYAISSVTYEETTAASDSVRVPPLPVRVDAAVDTVVTSTLPRTVHVTSGAASRPHAGTAPPVAPSRSPWTWILLASAALTLVGGGLYLWRTARPLFDSPGVQAPTAEPSPMPHDVAMRRLRTLQSHDLTDPDAVESFYVALSDTLRTYLSARLNVAIRERTTREVKAVLDRRAEIPPAAVESLYTVLEQADLVKFADARPGPSLAAEALQAAQTAIAAIEDAASAETSPEDATATSGSDAPLH